MAYSGIWTGAQIGANVEDASGFPGHYLALFGDTRLKVDIGLKPRAIKCEGLFSCVD